MSVRRTPYGPSLDEDDDPSDREAPLLAAGVKWYAADDLVLGAKAFVCGGTAGAVSKTCVAPLERVKIKLQVSSVIAQQQQSAMQIYAAIVKEEGALALWRGNAANVVRVIPNKGILFMCNDLYTKKLQTPGKPLTDTQRIIAGSLSGATIVCCTYPLDISQTRLASSSKNEFKGSFGSFPRFLDLQRYVCRKKSCAGEEACLLLM
jgi:solute carrier family 25 phosphate transporter 23/24/25/41